MAQQDFQQTTTSTTKADYSAGSISPDSPTTKKENFWDNSRFTIWFGHYTKHAKVKKAIDGFADWVLGQGFETDSRTKVILENITGNGKQSFDDIIWNAIVMKKVNGESYTHVIRNKETGTIVNMRSLNPQYMRVVYSGKGRVKEFRYFSSSEKNGEFVTYQPEEILHMINDHVADVMHGRSVIEAIEWNVEAQEEAKRVHRKLVWRAGVVRVIEVDTSNTAELAKLKAQYKTAEENGDVLLLPKDKAKAIDWKPNLDHAGIINWLNYLDDEFYISIGFPKVIAGASDKSTEAGGKISYLSHEPLYIKEITEVQDSLWNQLALKLEYKRQPSLMDNVQNDETKNQGQVGFQANDAEANRGKTA